MGYDDIYVVTYKLRLDNRKMVSAFENKKNENNKCTTTKHVNSYLHNEYITAERQHVTF